MRRLCLPLIGLAMYLGGCASATNAIADRVLIPKQSPERQAYLAEQRRLTGRRMGDRLKAFDYRSYDGTKLAALMLLPDRHALLFQMRAYAVADPEIRAYVRSKMRADLPRRPRR